MYPGLRFALAENMFKRKVRDQATSRQTFTVKSEFN